MSQLMLINPAKRPSKRKKARSPAQRAATKRMLAARRSNPAKRATTKSAKRRTYTALTSLRKRSKGRRRNPIGNSILGMFMPAAIGAVGAVAVNTLESQLLSRFMPDALQGNVGKYATRIALALALGTVGGKVIGNARARQAAEGALVVAMYDVIGSTMATVLPSIVGSTPVAAYAPAIGNSGMGAYAPMAGMGEMAESPYQFES